MGSLNTATVRTRPLTDDEDLALVIANIERITSDSWLQYLRDNQSFAQEMGKIVIYGGKSFADAYPGQTRLPRHTVTQVREAGYPKAAELMELLGLKKL